jgi:tetratricopeptide (TPR) repeat protein
MGKLTATKAHYGILLIRHVVFGAIACCSTLLTNAQNGPTETEAYSRYKRFMQYQPSRALADSFIIYGDLYSPLNYKIADSFFIRAIELGRLYKNDTVLVHATNGIGYYHYFQGNYYRSLQYFLQGKKLVEKFADEAWGIIPDNGIALIYLEVQLYDSAKKIIEATIDYGLRRKDTAAYLSAIGNMGWYYIKVHQPKEAVKLLRQFFNLYKFNGVSDAEGAINGASNLGEAYLMMGNADSAIYCLQKAKELSIEFDSRETIFYASCLLVNAWVRKGDAKKALHAYRVIDTVFLRHNMRADMVRLYYETSYLLDSAMGNIAGALKNHLLFKQWSDSTNAQLNIRGLTFLLENAKAQQMKLENEQLQFKNEMQKRNARNQRSYFISGALVLLAIGIAFYQWRMSKQRQKSERLNNEIRMAQLKALRSQMNPHFLFNLMASLEAKIENDPVTAQTILNQFSAMVRQSLEMSEHPFISLEEELDYLNNYCSLMQHNMGYRFAYTLKVTPDVDTATAQVPSMLIQPLLENAILHGFKDKAKGGKLELVISQSDSGDLVCTIQDNGPGIANLGEGQRKSFGQHILKKRMALYEQLLGRSFPLAIRNIMGSNGTVEGLEVILTLPSGHQ